MRGLEESFKIHGRSSFKDRVDKVFGSLASTRSSSLWSTADGEIERRLWRRGHDSSARDDSPCSSSFDDICKNQRKKKKKTDRRNSFGDDDDDHDHDQEEDDPDGIQDEPDESDIRSSIGLDPTLDFEEEEDEFDKVACGREGRNDRMYMREVSEHGPFLNSENVLGTNTKDPRANHLAAKFRLKEDETEAEQSRPIPKSRKRVRFEEA